MAMASVSMMQKAKLLTKGRWRPDKMVSKKMPDGSALLAGILGPSLHCDHPFLLPLTNSYYAGEESCIRSEM